MAIWKIGAFKAEAFSSNMASTLRGAIFSTAPTGPPRNVKADSVGSRNMTVSWQGLLSVHTNGPITGYEVTYIAQGARNGRTETTSKLFVEISKLLPYTRYHINVRAKNTAGYGPVSPTIVIQTREDGNVIFYLMLQITFVAMFDNVIVRRREYKRLQKVRWIKYRNDCFKYA